MDEHDKIREIQRRLEQMKREIEKLARTIEGLHEELDRQKKRSEDEN